MMKFSVNFDVEIVPTSNHEYRLSLYGKYAGATVIEVVPDYAKLVDAFQDAFDLMAEEVLELGLMGLGE